MGNRLIKSLLCGFVWWALWASAHKWYGFLTEWTGDSSSLGITVGIAAFFGHWHGSKPTKKQPPSPGEGA